MRRAVVIAQREFSSLFRVPVGWVVISLYLFMTGVLFVGLIAKPGSIATMSTLFSVSAWLLLPIAPAISMRLFAEETRLGTIEPLMTCPVSDVSVVLGKFLGACAFLVAMFAPTGLYVAILHVISNPAPDPGPIIAGYASVVLLGMFYISLGMLVSSLTSNQTLAYLGALLTLLLILIATETLSNMDLVTDQVKQILYALSIPARLRDFADGLIDTTHIVFFCSVTVLMLVLTTLSLESRRWR
ncbi:MAG: ABC transporter permease subunit [Phycisphaeraceae bacterium]|nr:ABC transporter permease subunit [Phycisphaerales bacterium]MCB9860501.1 ABC transporter permease subunit [Phycisphaeraceae bacterium]